MNFLVRTLEDDEEETRLYNGDSVDDMETFLGYCLDYPNIVKSIAIYKGTENVETIHRDKS